MKMLLMSILLHVSYIILCTHYILISVLLLSKHHQYYLNKKTNAHHAYIQTIYNTKRNEAELAFQEGKENLEILKRQVILGSLYPSAQSVMENVA